MKFAFLARILDYEGFGVQTHLTGLLQGISEIDHNHQLYLLVGPRQKVDQSKFKHRFEVVQFGPPPQTALGRLIWDHISVGNVCRQLEIDTLYAPAHVRPAYITCPTIVFVPDMIYHLFPGQWSWSDRFYFIHAVNFLTSRAQGLIALSENTKKDLLSVLKVPQERVKVIYPGAPLGFFPMSARESHFIRLKHGLENPFLLYTGSFHPRKNVTGIIAAFERIAGEIKHDLVLVGPPAWRTPEILSKIESSSFARRIRPLGLVPRHELPSFFNQADVFIYPSLYEGFGFPVLEALACGCPTVTSNVSSLPEVAGEAAILVNPEDISEISAAVLDILTDEIKSEYLRQQSLIQARKFTWELTSVSTLSLLESVTNCHDDI
jgi:glycosyltransferase involved in cell wall biosynthesis